MPKLLEDSAVPAFPSSFAAAASDCCRRPRWKFCDTRRSTVSRHSRHKQDNIHMHDSDRWQPITVRPKAFFSLVPFRERRYSLRPYGKSINQITNRRHHR